MLAGNVLPAGTGPQFSINAVQLRHAIPGRVRFYMGKLKWNEGMVNAWSHSVMMCPGVHDVVINEWCGSITIYHDPHKVQVQQLEEWLRDLSSGTHGPSTSGSGHGDFRVGVRHPDTPALIVSTIAVLVSYFFKPLATPTLPLLLLFTGADIWRKAYDSLVHEEGLSQDVVEGAVLGLLILQGEATTATLAVWLSTVGESLRAVTTNRSAVAIKALLPQAPEQIWVRQDGERVQQRVSTLSGGSTVVLYPGDRIPIDGTVAAGHGTVYEPNGQAGASLTAKQPGDPIASGSFLADGHLYVVMDRVGAETARDAIVRRAFARRSHETDLQQALVESANRFLPLTLSGAVLAGIFQGVSQATAVLMIDYGTGIKIAAPTAIVTAMLRATAHGIVVQDGRGLESLGIADTVMCTLAGPLMFGEPEVRDILTYRKIDEAQLLAWAAAAEVRFHHGIARAMVQAAKRREIAIPSRTDVQARLGGGVKALVEDRGILVGTPQFLASHGVAVSEAVVTDMQAAVSRGLLPVLVAVESEVLGVVLMVDRVRPEAREVIAALRQRGINDVRLLTGGDPHRARAVADQLDLTAISATNGPREKAQLVRDIRSTGRTVAVIGHSAADAGALAEASVAITLSGASPVARHLAHLVLSSDLSALPFAYDLSRETRQIMMQDRNLLVTANTTALALIAIGLLSPRMASWFNDGSNLLATLNSIRPLISMNCGRDVA